MADIKFGVALSPGPEDGSRGREFTSQVENYLAGLVDRYESVWFPDHLTGMGLIPDTCDILESITSISYLSALYKNFNFGTIVLCNSFRNPALLAKIGVTLDAFTGGRFVLGIGAGWYQDEYRQYGYEYPSAAVRIRQLEEGLQIIKKLWTEDAVTFKGKYYEVENAYCYPKPDPPPPIMIGCSGEKLSMKLVARYADWWNIQFSSVDTYRHKLDVLKSHCKKIGRDPDEILKTQLQIVAMAETDEEARKIANNSVYRRWTRIIGSPETVKRKMREHIEVGVDYFMLLFLPFPNPSSSISFAEEIMPELKEN